MPQAWEVIKMKELNKTIENMLVMLWNFFIIGGTAYLVFFKEHSGWWFALAYCFLARSTEEFEDTK